MWSTYSRSVFMQPRVFWIYFPVAGSAINLWDLSRVQTELAGDSEIWIEIYGGQKSEIYSKVGTRKQTVEQ